MSEDKLAERALFGSSSSSDDDEEKEEEEKGVESADDDDEASERPHFELLRGSRLPRGLSLHRGALDRETARTLFDVLSKGLEEGGGAAGGRQAFFFPGEGLPRWALALSARALSTLLQSGSWPRELAEREPLFDMAAVNSYGSSETGLRQHVDLPRFADGVAIFSLGVDAVMRFEEVEAATTAAAAAAAAAVATEGRGGAKGAREEEKEKEKGKGAVACLLRDGDLLLLRGEARWRWTHGFGSGDHCLKGESIDRSKGMRIGVTLRKMKKEEGSG